MSGRHTMPPAGRRKAAAESAESTEPDTVEDTATEDAVVEESVDANVIADEPAPAETDEPADEADVTEETEEADEAEEVDEPAEEAKVVQPSQVSSGVSLAVVLAVIALVLAAASGVLRWLIVTQDQSATARDEAVQAAKEITAEMLSYETETVDQQLTAARDRMTGDFLGTYTAMINEVIPAAHAQQIAAVAEVLRAGVVSAKPESAELVLFVNQSVQVGNSMPKKTASVARATMVKEGDHWMLSEYEPVPL